MEPRRWDADDRVARSRRGPSRSRSRSTTPTQQPARSNDVGSIRPGCSAVSPPTSAQPASRQPAATSARFCTRGAGDHGEAGRSGSALPTSLLGEARVTLLERGEALAPGCSAGNAGLILPEPLAADRHSGRTTAGAAVAVAARCAAVPAAEAGRAAVARTLCRSLPTRACRAGDARGSRAQPCEPRPACGARRARHELRAARNRQHLRGGRELRGRQTRGGDLGLRAQVLSAEELCALEPPSPWACRRPVPPRRGASRSVPLCRSGRRGGCRGRSDGSEHPR